MLAPEPEHHERWGDALRSGSRRTVWARFVVAPERVTPRLTITYRPSAGRRMRVVGARVNYPGTEAEWKRDTKWWAKMSRAKWPRESEWTVDSIELTLATWTDSDTADDIAK